MYHPNRNHAKTLSTLFLLAGLSMAAQGGESASSAPAKATVPAIETTAAKPAWLTEFSLGVREGYDDNVFYSNVEQRFVPKGTQTLKDRASWVTTISPRLVVNLVPVLGKQDLFQTLSLGYTPDYVLFHDQSSETYYAHRFTGLIKAKTGAVTVTLDNCFTYVDGSNDGPVYPGSLLNAYSTIMVKDRREQIQDKGKLSIQYDQDRWFVRPVASLIAFDMMTHLKNPELASTPSGYQNYPDRYDVNGGLDFGYKVLPDFALTIGYRYGQQIQEQFSWNKYSSSNSYHRALFGFEGKPWKWLKVQCQLGPDFRSYEGDTPTHITPVHDHNPIVFYGEASATAEITRRDSVAFQFKQFRWLSSLGQVPYQDSCYELTYSRKLTDKLTADLKVRALEADYNAASISSGHRDDWMLTFSAIVRYAITPNLSVDAGYSLDKGYNAEADVVNPQNREFSRTVLSAGLQLKF